MGNEVMSEIENIPADQPLEMTDLWYRAFIANGCKPCCHATGKWIEVGDKFQLLTIQSHRRRNQPHLGGYSLVNYGELATREVMISGDVDANEFQATEYKEHERYLKRKAEQGGGCYRVNGKIVKELPQ